VILAPTPKEFPELARTLLDLADSVYHVQTTTDTPTLGLVIPDYLYQRYMDYLDLSESSSPEEPKRRGPGRPRKNPLPEQEQS
jgi:hypothetical protein